MNDFDAGDIHRLKDAQKAAGVIALAGKDEEGFWRLLIEELPDQLRRQFAFVALADFAIGLLADEWSVDKNEAAQRVALVLAAQTGDE